jgi:hypothetical protein
MKTLHIYCDGGFGNRFNALVSGLLIARKTGLTPLVIWPVNNWCGATFDQLLVRPAGLQVIDKELLAFVPERDAYRFLIVEDHLGIAPDGYLHPLHVSGWPEIERFVLDADRDVFYYTALIPSVLPEDEVRALVRELAFEPSLVSRAAQFIQAHQLSEFYGVQIRKTDFGDRGADDENLFKLLKDAVGKRFFVCSDDAAVEQRFQTLPHVVTHEKRQHVAKRVEGDWLTPNADHSGRVYACNVERSDLSVMDAVVDLLILSMSQIVRTSGSTFLNTAILIRASRMSA